MVSRVRAAAPSPNEPTPAKRSKPSGVDATNQKVLVCVQRSVFVMQMQVNVTTRALVGRVSPVMSDAAKGVAADKQALLDFKKSIGPGANDLKNWGSNKPLSEWEGVYVNEEGRVRSLELAKKDFAGPIPSGLEKLTELDTLNLRENKFTGPIPPGLDKLTNLKKLVLAKNELTGTIPSELGKLKKLEHLHLSENKLSGHIPKALEGLSQLEMLVLSDNKLTGEIPPGLGKFKDLHLYNNNLSGTIPFAKNYVDTELLTRGNEYLKPRERIK